MSHELRTPLNTILGFSELLSEERAGVLNEKQKRFVAHIQGDANHLLELINDILDLSKIEAGRLELRLEPFAMAVAVAEVLTSIRPLAAAKNITVDSDVDTSLMLQADRLRFKEILLQPAEQCHQIHPGGRAHLDRIDGRARSRSLPGWRYRNRHRYRGSKGDFRELPPGQRYHQRRARRNWLGPRHYQTPGRASRWKDLGKERARQGKPIFFTLPTDGSQSVTDQTGLGAETPATGPLLLITSHHAVWREEAANLLEREGFATNIAASGADAFHKAKDLRPDLILLDIDIASKSGWGLYTI